MFALLTTSLILLSSLSVSHGESYPMDWNVLEHTSCVGTDAIEIDTMGIGPSTIEKCVELCSYVKCNEFTYQPVSETIGTCVYYRSTILCTIVNTNNSILSTRKVFLSDSFESQWAMSHTGGCSETPLSTSTARFEQCVKKGNDDGANFIQHISPINECNLFNSCTEVSVNSSEVWYKTEYKQGNYFLWFDYSTTVAVGVISGLALIFIIWLCYCCNSMDKIHPRSPRHRVNRSM